jgi:hypothetical protein
MLGPWIEQQRPHVNAQQRKAHRAHFVRFLDWTQFFGLRMPVSDIAVAGYLLEMLAAGVPAEEITAAATAVRYCYEQNRAFLDPTPINAALALVRAQSSPYRVIQ